MLVKEDESLETMDYRVRLEVAYQNGYKHTYNDKMQSKGILQFIRKLSNLDIVLRGLFLEEVFLKYCIRPPMVVLCLV